MFYSQSFDMVRLTQVSLNIYTRQFIESVQKNWLYFSGKKSAESNTNDVSWIFTETGHGKGPMDGVGAAIKNAIDDVVIATESMPDVSVRSASQRCSQNFESCECKKRYPGMGIPILKMLRLPYHIIFLSVGRNLEFLKLMKYFLLIVQTKYNGKCSQRIKIFFSIGIHPMHGWTATTRHGVTWKKAQKILLDTENLFRKNLQLKDVC